MPRKLLILFLLPSACLDPLVDDAVDPALFFGDPTIDPASAPHVQDAGDGTFVSDVAYLRAFADGAPVWYWDAGPSPAFVVPIWQVLDANDDPVGRPIIDVLPEDPGYSPWWRRYTAQTTAQYDGERIWSRAGLDAAVRAGILEKPVATDQVLNCPVVDRNLRVDVGGAEVPPISAWYRDQRVSLLSFSDAFLLPTSERELPKMPVYILQRINEAAPIYERVTRVDLDGDHLLKSSNNIFSGGLGSARYSPLWYPVMVRVVADYPSIETGSVGFDDERDLFLDAERTVTATAVVDIQPDEETLVNCPVQRERGAL